jgi:hypothetical protein
MFRRKVKDPHGRKWTLGRHWMPRRKRFKKADLDMPDFLGDFGGDDLGIFAAIFLAIAAVILTFFLALLLFNVVALAIELSIVIIVALVGLIGRVVFRRPWTVFAKSADQQIEYPVVGYFNSKRRIAELATALSSGAQLPPGHR